MNFYGNNIEDTDSYKLHHYEMYPDNTQRVYSYFECRNGAKYPSVKMFGLQPLLYQLMKPVTHTELKAAYELSKEHGLPLNLHGWEYILDTYHGKLPLNIKAIPEGMVVPVSTALITVENTDDSVPWLTNYCETMLSRIWYPVTVASYSYAAKKVLRSYLEKTSDDMSILDFQLHDFGSRGTSCREQAAIGGAAHLTNFMGTDTVIALRFLKDFYDAPTAAGFSVNATEHSIMTSMGAEGEEALFEHLLDKYPTGILSVVIDSYNYQHFITVIAAKFKDKILAREGKVVFRPDSGEPVYTSMDVFLMLENVFGITMNSKGYRVLNPKVGLLWGDGIDLDGLTAILDNFYVNNVSSANIVFGMGGGLLQKLNRDTMRCAFKCSAQKQGGKWVDIMKNPLDHSKISKKGKLGVIWDVEGQIITVNQKDGRYAPEGDLLQLVYNNGILCRKYGMTDIRRSW